MSLENIESSSEFLQVGALLYQNQDLWRKMCKEYEKIHDASVGKSQSEDGKIKAENEGKKPLRRRFDTTNTSCAICNQQNVGLRFGVYCCDPCMQFFRKTIYNKRSYGRCYLSGGKCNVNQVTRNICKLCRLKKCFETGMEAQDVLKNYRQRKSKRQQQQQQQQWLMTDRNTFAC